MVTENSVKKFLNIGTCVAYNIVFFLIPSIVIIVNLFSSQKCPFLDSSMNTSDALLVSMKFSKILST